MNRQAIIDELSTDLKYSHGFSAGRAGTGVNLLSSKGPRGKDLSAIVIYCGQLDRENRDYHCRLHIMRVMQRKLLFFKSIEHIELAVIYPIVAGARRSAAGYALFVPGSEAARIEAAVLGDPTILLDVFERVFPKEFAQQNRGHELEMDSAWDKNVKTRVF